MNFSEKSLDFSGMNNLILITDILEKLILLLMFGLSIWSISIIIERRRFFKTQKIEVSELKKIIENQNWQAAQQWCENHSQYFVSQGLSQVFKSKDAVRADRQLLSFIKEQRPLLEKNLSVLATLGANAPFIGLFGTVLGIIRAFAYLGNNSASASVMSGVSQALYATAVGLFVAIPAVVAYNYFSQLIRFHILQIESLKDLYLTFKE
jgi:biopolymer transport protein ExbB/TolQ